MIQVEYFGGKYLLAAEGQQALGQGRTSLCRFYDFAGVSTCGLIRQLLIEQFGIAADCHQDVIEVVSYAAGEPADRLDFLHLAQLLFQFAVMP